MSSSKHIIVFLCMLAVSCVSEYIENIENVFFGANINDNVTKRTSDTSFTELEEARKKKKNKYILPILLGGLMLKAVILPLAFKTMAAMTSISVLLSALSLIISSISGFAKYAWNYAHPTKNYKIDDIWAKEDDVFDSYGYSAQYPDYKPSGPPLKQGHLY